MRDLFMNFAKDEGGASLVEYAVALIVVTIVGGAGVVAVGGNAGSLADAGCDQTNAAVTAAIAADTGTVTVDPATAC